MLFQGSSGEVSAACHFLGTSQATLAVMRELNEGAVNLVQARAHYAFYITNILKEQMALEMAEDPKKVNTPFSWALEKYIFS